MTSLTARVVSVSVTATFFGAGVLVGFLSFREYAPIGMTDAWIGVFVVGTNFAIVGLWTMLGETVFEDVVKAILVSVVGVVLWRLSPAFTFSLLTSAFLGLLSSQICRAITRATVADRNHHDHTFH